MTARGMALMALLSASLIGPARAELVSTEPVHRVGDVRSGTVLTHAFTLVNRGSSQIDLLEVKPGCNCVNMDVGSVVFKPGEQGKLTVYVNTVAQAAGQNSWRVLVRYRENDGDHELPLFLTANVIPEIVIQPASLVIYTASGIGHRFTMLEHRQQPLQVFRVGGSSPHVRARLTEPRQREDKVWVREIILEVLPTCPEGRLDDILHVITNDPAYPALKVPFAVNKQVPGKVQASPEAIDLHSLKGHALPARIILLSSNDERPVRVNKIETSDPFIHCSYAIGPGLRSTLRLQVESHEITLPKFEGQVRVYLESPVPQMITIPVRVSR